MIAFPWIVLHYINRAKLSLLDRSQWRRGTHSPVVFRTLLQYRWNGNSRYVSRVHSLHSTSVPAIALWSGTNRHRWLLKRNPLLSWAECRLGNDFYGSLMLAARCIMVRDWMAVKHSSGYCHHIFNSILHFNSITVAEQRPPVWCHTSQHNCAPSQ